MYYLEFTVDTEHGEMSITMEKFRGTWEEMTNFVNSYGLVKRLTAVLVAG
jgi:hypothetical protein